ncbi:MAG: tetratricopeptide repeat protein [Thermodesulfobacteriota bacterium]|nr:tetratricopeptide repeat protein [Thermodesulfobacteriota bacterium]
MNARILLTLILATAIAVSGCATAKKRQEQADKTRRLGEAYLQEGNLPGAYRELLKAKELAPEDAHVYYDLGLFAYKRKMFDKAIEFYIKAIELKPDFASAVNNLGVVYLETGQWDKAIQILTPLTEDYAYATPHFAHQLLGQAFFNKHDYATAIEHFQEAIALQPDYPFAHFWLGRTFLKTRQIEIALVQLQKAVELMPQAAAFHLSLGRAFYWDGQYTKAADAAARALSLATEPDLAEDARRLKQQALRKNG